MSFKGDPTNDFLMCKGIERGLHAKTSPAATRSGGKISSIHACTNLLKDCLLATYLYLKPKLHTC